jgi:hypothetical protein
MEASNYKLLMQCHCPELILTSIDFALIRSSFGFGDDLQILLVTLTKIIESGADRAASHLINRLGLIAWARAFLLRGYVIPNSQVRAAFLQMLTALLKLGRLPETVMPIDDFAASTRGMAQCVLSFAMAQSHNQQHIKQSKSTIGQVLHYSCEIIFILSQALNALNGATPTVSGTPIHCQSDGIHLDLAIQFVEALRPSFHHVPKAIVAVSILPIQINGRDIASLRKICKILIDEHESIRNQTSESKLAILRRLCFISQYLHPTADETSDVLQCLLSWRSDCIGCSKLREVWYEIMKILAPIGSDQNVDFLMCTSNKLLLPLFILQNENN